MVTIVVGEKHDKRDVTRMVGRVTGVSGWGLWREKIFSFLSKLYFKALQAMP